MGFRATNKSKIVDWNCAFGAVSLNSKFGSAVAGAEYLDPSNIESWSFNDF